MHELHSRERNAHSGDRSRELIQETDSGNSFRKLTQEIFSRSWHRSWGSCSRNPGPYPGGWLREHNQGTHSGYHFQNQAPWPQKGDAFTGRHQGTASHNQGTAIGNTYGILIRNLDCAGVRLATVNSPRRSSPLTAVHNHGLGPDTATRDPHFAKHAMHPADQGTCYGA